MRRLGEDRRVRRATATPGAAAAAVEHRQLDAALTREPRELLLRAEDLPLGGDDSAVLARVRVADHHLERGRAATRRAAPRTRSRAPRRSSIVSSSGTTVDVEPGVARRAPPPSRTSSADRVIETISVSIARRPVRRCSCGASASTRRDAGGSVAERARVQTDVERGPCSPKTSSRRRSAASPPSAIRSPPCARRLARGRRGRAPSAVASA